MQKTLSCVLSHTFDGIFGDVRRDSAGTSGILGGFGINCMLPLLFELILETVYGFVRDDVAATTTMLTMSLGSTEAC